LAFAVLDHREAVCAAEVGGRLLQKCLHQAGTATFLAEDKAILFMRYIRKHMEFLKRSMDQKGSLEFGAEPGKRYP